MRLGKCDHERDVQVGLVGIRSGIYDQLMLVAIDKIESLKQIFQAHTARFIVFVLHTAIDTTHV